jgi:DNA-binding response OmpR family regulator
MLPDLDGFEVCRRMRAAGVDVPVIFLSARSGLDDRLRGLTLGGDDYLPKPFSVEELVARSRAILRRRGAVTKTFLTMSGTSTSTVSPPSSKPSSRHCGRRSKFVPRGLFTPCAAWVTGSAMNDMA